jgi:hypothetical protein
MPNTIQSSLPPALAALVDAEPDWRWPFIEWRVTHEGQLEAIAHSLKNESVWRLVCDLMESAVQAGWDAGAQCRPEQSQARTPELVTAG